VFLVPRHSSDAEAARTIHVAAGCGCDPVQGLL
jgi:hypothetical protein